MKKLIIVNTFYQLIVAISIKHSIYINVPVDIIISDASVGYERIYENIQKCRLFENVYSAKVRYTKNLSYFQKIMLVVKSLLNNRKIVSDRFEIDFSQYDVLLFNNEDYLTYWISMSLLSFNKKSEFYKFEEGCISYIKKFSPNNSYTILTKLHRILNRVNIQEGLVDKFLYFFPEMLSYPIDQNMKIDEIPVIKKSDKNLVDMYNSIFTFENNSEFIGYKYIYFEESIYDFDNTFDDVSVVKFIAKVVGKENLIIKRHPRLRENRFGNMGLNTNCTFDIPWEIFELNFDFTKCCFITISSSSVINSQLLFGDHIKTIFLYDCIQDKSPMIMDGFLEYIQKFKNASDKRKVYAPKNFFELEEILNEQ